MCALNIFMNLVFLEWCLVQSSEVKDKEVLAPGIGLGWGVTNGVFCSRKVILNFLLSNYNASHWPFST